jgi:hypothetical protein
MQDLKECQPQAQSIEEFTEALSGWLQDLRPVQSQSLAGSRQRLGIRQILKRLGLR